MAKNISLQDLWDSALVSERSFQAANLSHLPESAQRYLTHAIAPGALLSHAVRLRMHGEIKVKRWLPFKAEQVIVWERGFIWKATARMFGIPISGFDRLIDGKGEMRWKIFGIFPVMTASGADITRSAAGRICAESIWLPSALCDDHVSWSSSDKLYLHAGFTAHAEKTDLEFQVGEKGQLETVKLSRWGNPEGNDFHYANFGAIIEEESMFGGYTIPSRLRVGWHFGTDRFESEGEFFRAIIDDATYR